MAANALTPIPNLHERQSGESRVITPASTIPPPTPHNPIAARRVSVSAATKPTGILKTSTDKPVEAAELSGKRIVGWGITHNAGHPAPILVLMVKGENDPTPTRYELHVADRGVSRSPAQRTHLRPDPGFLAPNLLGPYKLESFDEAVETPANDLRLGIRIISAALVPRPGRAWENNGAVRLVEHLALRLVLEPTPEASEESGAALGHARSGSTGGPKTVFVRARTTERDRAPNSTIGSHVPNDGSDEEADHVGDRTSIGEDVILVRG